MTPRPDAPDAPDQPRQRGEHSRTPPLQPPRMRAAVPAIVRAARRSGAARREPVAPVRPVSLADLAHAVPPDLARLAAVPPVTAGLAAGAVLEVGGEPLPPLTEWDMATPWSVDHGAVDMGAPVPVTRADVAIAICCAVAGGADPADAIRAAGLDRHAWVAWRARSPMAAALWGWALREYGDTLALGTLEVARAVGSRGEPATAGEVAAARLEVEARQWLAARVAPDRWGDSRRVQRTSDTRVAVSIVREAPPATVATRWRQLAEAESGGAPPEPPAEPGIDNR